MDTRFTGKVAVVTGGGSGMGAATCRRLARRGAASVIGDIDGALADAVAKEIGDQAIGVQFDAGDPVTVKALIDAAIDRSVTSTACTTTRRSWRLITSPATQPGRHRLRALGPQFAVNIRGYLAGCKYAIPHMLEAGGGAIVNTASGSALLGDLGAIAYGSSKGAVITMAKYIATIYGKQNIRCNAINPGLIRTEGGKRNVFGPMVDIQLRNTLTPRLGESEDIANIVAFLLSDEAAFMTGSIIDVDGGMLCHMPYMTDVLAEYGNGMAFGTR